MQYDTTLTRDELRRTVTAIEPRWGLREAEPTPSEAGHHALYRVGLDTPEGTVECYLKATPEGKDATLGLEARILTILNDRMALPVPEVHGLVERGDGLPTPAVLLDALPGQAISRTEPSALTASQHRRVARDVGRHLATLHAVDAVDSFGCLQSDGPTLGGERPSGDPEELSVRDPATDWRALLREWADAELDGLEDGRFSDLVPAMEQTLHERIDGLRGPFDPALARIDQSLENLLVDDSRVTGLIDWEFTMATTPAYDAVHVAASLAGGPFVFAPSVVDRRELVFEGLLDGYGERAAEHVEQIRANRECYELLCAVRAMANLADWYGMLGLTDETDEAAAALRREVGD
jgi:aminoglycoside phosphotransferase (APT) family kinase protein